MSARWGNQGFTRLRNPNWFTGSRATMTIAADHGCYFSVNAAMLKSENGRRLLAAIPRNRLLTETDGPFTQQGGRAARPSDIAQTVAQLAQFLGVPGDELGRQIRLNLKSLLG